MVMQEVFSLVYLIKSQILLLLLLKAPVVLVVILNAPATHTQAKI